MSDETKIFTKNDKNGDKCASGGQESGLKLIFERGVAILVRPWRFPGQPKKFVFFSIKVGTINSGTSLDSREQFKKTGKLEKGKNEMQMLMKGIMFLLAFSLCGASLSADEVIFKFNKGKIFGNASLAEDKQGYTMEKSAEGLLVKFQKY